jgi:5-methylcytosine-specific restriction endonuclease McrA
LPKPKPQLIERREAKTAKLAGWQKVRKVVLERDKRTCRACGSRDYIDVHHKKLRSAGGGNTTDNLLCLCRYCHAMVHAYMLFIHGASADGTLRFEAVK